ncbi:MAG: RNA-binding protein [Clostridiales bacterium]|nr:RNA-binding protein [Clostridiales bacterium]
MSHHNLLNSPEEKEIYDKIKGKIITAQKRGAVCFTDFQNPYQLEIGAAIINSFDGICFFEYGGFENAERKIFVIYPEFVDPEDIEIPLKAIRIVSLSKTTVLEHKDVLGSILGLGLRRDKIGDILIDGNSADIVLYKETAEYISLFLDKIGKDTVSCQEISFDLLNTLKQKSKTINTTVASLRADAVISSGLGESRSHAVRYIQSGKLKINHKEIISPSYLVKEGDLISIRGKGRMILEKVEGITKKDRIKIVIKRII